MFSVPRSSSQLSRHGLFYERQGSHVPNAVSFLPKLLILRVSGRYYISLRNCSQSLTGFSGMRHSCLWEFDAQAWRAKTCSVWMNDQGEVSHLPLLSSLICSLWCSLILHCIYYSLLLSLFDSRFTTKIQMQRVWGLKGTWGHLIWSQNTQGREFYLATSLLSPITFTNASPLQWQWFEEIKGISSQQR